MTPQSNSHDYRDGLYVWDETNPHGYGNRMGRYRTRVECDFMARHLGPAPLRVLDVGGGSGRLGTFFHALGHRVTVVDHNPDAVVMAKAKGFEQAVVGDLMQYDGRDFDVVACMEVIEYFKNCGPVLAKCAEFTKPGGIFLFCVVNAQSWRYQLRKFKHSDFPAQASTPAEVEAACRAAGLEVIERRGFQWCLAPTGSDSRLVTFSNGVEKWLGLQRWHGQSPWLLYAARRLAQRAGLAVACLMSDWLVTTTEMCA
jgi:2-polyprenyl-3-methyl-5-hydroxy-6-metoxy-1,4-benzoquinol methylase